MFAFVSNTRARLRQEEKGATAVEYGIMVALIAVVIIAAVSLFGTGLRDTFTQAQCSVTNGTFTAAEKAVAEVKDAAGTITTAKKDAVPAKCA